MNQQTKKIIKIGLIVLAVVLLGLIIWKVVSDLTSDGYAYYGDVWYDTPEEAIRKTAEDDPTIDDGVLDVRVLLDKIYVDDYVEVLFVSDVDTLVRCVCVKNDEGKWAYQGHSEEHIEDPHSFVLNGDDEQFIMFSYQHSGDYSTVYGWKYSDSKSVLVNGAPTLTKTYTFNINNKEWSVDYWWAENVSAKSTDDIKIDYSDN